MKNLPFLLILLLFACNKEEDVKPANHFLDDYYIFAQIENNELSSFKAMIANNESLVYSTNSASYEIDPLAFWHDSKFGEVEVWQEGGEFNIFLAGETFNVYPDHASSNGTEEWSFNGNVTGNNGSVIRLRFSITVSP